MGTTTSVVMVVCRGAAAEAALGLVVTEVWAAPVTEWCEFAAVVRPPSTS